MYGLKLRYGSDRYLNVPFQKDMSKDGAQRVFRAFEADREYVALQRNILNAFAMTLAIIGFAMTDVVTPYAVGGLFTVVLVTLVMPAYWYARASEQAASIIEKGEGGDTDG